LLQAAVRATNHTRTTTKDLKLGETPKFSGKTEDLEDFINSCEMIFYVKADIYDTDEKKISYALTYMVSGNAELWKKQYIQGTLAKQGVSSRYVDTIQTKTTRLIPRCWTISRRHEMA
jgi:hypothetical protein